MTEVTWLPTSSAWIDDEWLIQKLGPPPSTNRRRKRSKKERKLIRRLERSLAEQHWDDNAALRQIPARPAPVFEKVEWQGGPVRLVFCDFDGVLNDSSSGSYRLLVEHVARLDRLVRQADARLVVSSWWRWKGVAELRTDLMAAGFKGRVIGRTPWLSDSDAWDAYERGTEVQAALDHIGDKVEAFVILDDHDRMGPLLPYLVQTDATQGLTDADVEAALAVLNAQVEILGKVNGIVDTALSLT